MHDAFNRTVRGIADRIGELFRPDLQFGGIGHELTRDRIVRIGPVDQIGKDRRHRDGIARRDGLQSLLRLGRDQARIDEAARVA